MKRIAAALFMLALTGCVATIDRPRPAPTPQVVYVRDEAAIAEARTDGAMQAVLASAVVGVGTVVLGSIAYAVTHTRHEREPAHIAHIAPHVTYNITYDQRTVVVQSPNDSAGRAAARAMLRAKDEG